MADLSTVVSLIPYSFSANFPHTSPGEITIPACEIGDFNLTYISRAYSRVYVDSDRGYIQKPITSDEIATSIINDHIGSVINVQPGHAQPGLFFVDGHPTKDEVKRKHAKELEHAKDLQKNWFIELVKQADHDWGRTHSPRSISTLQRAAAKFLGLAREWDVNTVIDNITLCPMCKNDTRGAIICPNCKFIMDTKAYEAVKNQFAKA